MSHSPGNAALLRRMMVSAFLMDAGFFLVLAAIPYRVLALGGGPVALGLASAISSLTYIVLTRLAGRWSDTSGRFGMILWSTIAYAAFALFASSVARLPLLLLSMPLLGVGNAFYWPTVQAAVGDLAGPGGLAREIGRFNVAWSAGKTAGYLAGGLLLAATGFRTAFLTGAGLVALAFALLLGVRAAAQAGPRPDDAAPSGEDVPEATRRAFRRMGWWANFAAFHGAGCQDASLRYAVCVRSGNQRPPLCCVQVGSGAGSTACRPALDPTHTRRSSDVVLLHGEGTTLPSGTRWPIASFGSAGEHSLQVGTPDVPGPRGKWILSPVTAVPVP